MQITINQTEIEAAIKAHILSQINIKEGHDISITLKATRGDDGTTAIIDITPSENPAPTPVPSTPVKRESASLGIKETVAKAKEEKPADPPFQPDTAASASTDGAAAETGTAENASADQDKSKEGDAEPAPRTSLFAGLKKPNNG